MDDKLQKWRLILGKKSDEGKEISSLSPAQVKMDAALDALYDAPKRGGLSQSAPFVNRWLGDIRNYFPKQQVLMMQKDALERLNIKEMLLEPELLENLEVDVHLAATLISLSKVMPEETRSSARMVIDKLVKKLEEQLRPKMEDMIKGALKSNHRNRRPKPNEIHWAHTIRANLKHYQEEYKSIIPEKLIGYGKKSPQLKHIIILQDQSGSMASSMVYSGIIAGILAKVKSLKTHLIGFDTSVADLSAHLPDAVEVLLASQLGGGTDISKALTYAEKLVDRPEDTIMVLISDLYEGGSVSQLLHKASAIRQSGVQFITLLSLSDEGAPDFNHDIAQQFQNMDIPSFACTPEAFPKHIAALLK